MANDIKYVEKGPKGRTCTECKHYKPLTKDSTTGKCMGYKVGAGASCNLFTAKGKTK